MGIDMYGDDKTKCPSAATIDFWWRSGIKLAEWHVRIMYRYSDKAWRGSKQDTYLKHGSSQPLAEPISAL